MSILIKGMKMPKNCDKCELCIWLDHQTRPTCAATGEEFSVKDMEQKRGKDCPLVELPPHGDLIDREAALYALCEAVHNVDGEIPCANQIVSCTWEKTRVQEYAEEILAIPTIIEAEGKI